MLAESLRRQSREWTGTSAHRRSPRRPRRGANMTVDRDARTRLRALCDKAAEGPWFVEHGARADGLSRVDDGRQHGLYSFYCEAHEAAFIAASREAVPELLDMVDAQAKDVDIWKDKAKFRLARAEKAEAALRPFAEAANDWDDAEDS